MTARETPSSAGDASQTQPASVSKENGINGYIDGSAEARLPTKDVLAMRKRLIGPNTALNYQNPLHIVRGVGCHLYDAAGVEYLDCVNNVAHVGHSHPKVAAAVAKQMFMLNTNIRYLHENLVTHVEALVATFPEPLKVAYAVCSGSEANDLALRISRAAVPGATHVAIVGGAYHGHTMAVIDLSPYKYDGPGGTGRAPHVHVLPCPDPYQGVHLDGRAAARAAIAEAHKSGGRISAFFCESVLSCGGQVILPEGYLAAVYEEMRAEGALCIADEVQCGFGRAGSHFWAFEMQGVVPDIVTLGKPIGNGFPMGAVVTSAAHAAAFSNGMEYFNTCGGCTAAGAAGLAVLRAIEEDGLQANAATVGLHLLAMLGRICEDFDCVGDVRGMGLMVGIEMVCSKASKRQAPAAAKWVKEAMLRQHVLLSTDGPFENVVKIKPPMCFGIGDADRMLGALRAVLKAGLPQEVIEADWAIKLVPHRSTPPPLKCFMDTP